MSIASRLIEEGRQKGRAEGRAEGHTEGRAEGHAEGRAEGHAEGRHAGKREATRDALLSVLAARFGPVTADLRDRIAAGDLDSLATWLARAAVATSAHEVLSR